MIWKDAFLYFVQIKQRKRALQYTPKGLAFRHDKDLRYLMATKNTTVLIHKPSGFR